jgi:hypothetical protein
MLLREVGEAAGQRAGVAADHVARTLGHEVSRQVVHVAAPAAGQHDPIARDELELHTHGHGVIHE